MLCVSVPLRFVMSLVQFLIHLIHFVLPALALAVCMPLAGRWVMGAGSKGAGSMAWPRRVFWHALAGVGVLVAGLLIQGHDGRMATYVALVLVAATLEWALHRGWLRR